MITLQLLFIAVGLAIDIWFIKTELAGEMKKAVLLKGLASLVFVLLGVLCFINHGSDFGKLIVIGLVLGMAGDVLLNLRNLYEGGLSMRIFAVGILAFLGGHFLYIAALIGRGPETALIALIMTAVLSVLSIPPLIRRITAPNKGLKIFGYVYLVIVIAMFSFAASLLTVQGAGPLNLLFAAGALLFVVSDFIMIYYTFGRKLKPLRAANLLCYYVGQLMIACSILLA